MDKDCPNYQNTPLYIYIHTYKTHDSELQGREEAGHTRRMSVLL